ncbi:MULTISPECIES: MarR family winged helix-turn-helix transcriptional regulator [Methylobacillus]|uniref:Transcriptional regulator, MarR family n=1 Tax=Methylobacillus flagellatus (strain ATCC 51484 / DSM 6875 / VKM B-1610 / KT) TaxID=265072 RepID=Q1GYR1_METFK|nr:MULTISPECIES: MarR family transcriptional regulator [Methylobacillus]ABE50626.1 transcriptional regulator, MarR family [Methylobacillus flagellatus KT]MPS47773.1 MarR family transcriptional regulator [Methylobacillus sp.]
MLQLRDLPSKAVLDKFSARYPEADVSAVSSFLHLLRVASDLSLALDACLSQHGLLQGRWWVLILLMREENGISLPSVLAEKAGVSRATMTGLIDGLERDGLVERIFDRDDRRRVSIRLTAAGQEKLDQVMPDYYTRLRQCMAAVNEEERVLLGGILGKLNAGISAFDVPGSMRTGT